MKKAILILILSTTIVSAYSQKADSLLNVRINKLEQKLGDAEYRTRNIQTNLHLFKQKYNRGIWNSCIGYGIILASTALFFDTQNQKIFIAGNTLGLTMCVIGQVQIISSHKYLEYCRIAPRLNGFNVSIGIALNR